MKEPERIPGSEITPEATYLNRRLFIRAGIVAATAIATGTLYRRLNRVSNKTTETAKLEGLVTPQGQGTDKDGFRTNEPLTSLQNITHYNNFYEFSTDKGAVA